MRVKWHGLVSSLRDLPGGGAMGSTLGVWEYLSQTNSNTDMVPEEDRFKFVDDLTVLEIVNLLSVGLSSYNITQQVPSDIPTHGQFIHQDHLKTQDYLNQINEWTENQQMVISQQKTKSMIFNFNDKYQFTTRLQLKGENVEIVDQMKILGTIVRSDLSWNSNCEYLIKKVNKMMQLVRNLVKFGATKTELVHL